MVSEYNFDPRSSYYSCSASFSLWDIFLSEKVQTEILRICSKQARKKKVTAIKSMFGGLKLSNKCNFSSLTSSSMDLGIEWFCLIKLLSLTILFV